MSNLLEPPTKTLQTERLNIARIRTDGCTQARTSLDEKTITEYVEAMIAGETFPPVTVFCDGNDYWLADGFHRLKAARRIQASEILVDVWQGTRREAILYAVGANTKHGLRRSNADKRKAVEILLNDPEWSQWSNRELARRCGVSLDLVNRLRRKMNSTERFVQSKNFTNGFSNEFSGADELTSQLKRKCADGRIINVANIGKIPIGPRNDIPITNFKEDNPALAPAIDMPEEEHLSRKESKAIAEFEIGSFVQVIDKDSPQFQEICKIVSIEYTGVNIFTSQGEMFFHKKDVELFVSLENTKSDLLPKGLSIKRPNFSQKKSSYFRVISIEKENYHLVQNTVQTIEVTSSGLHIKIECYPITLIHLFHQMQESQAFYEEVMQQCKLFDEDDEIKYDNPK